MKYLNNTTTGEVIRITKVTPDRIFYTIFENSFLTNQNKFGISKSIENKTIEVPNIFEGDNINSLEFESYKAALIIIENEPNFTISDDERNWYITTGSSGNEDIAYRVFISNKAYDNALKDKDIETNEYYNLWLVIDFATQNIKAQYSQITDNSIVIYLATLLDEHKLVLKSYEKDGVVIEPKELVEEVI